MRWPDGRIEELGGGEKRATNNRMELMAALRAIERVRKDQASTREQRILILTDSMYLINGMTKWAHGWARKGWPEDLANRELWQELYAVRGHLEWRHVRGHAGIPGNERADQIAVGFSKGAAPALFVGAATEYPVQLSAALPPSAPPSAGDTSHTVAPSPASSVVYLSLVDGKLERHTDWKSCEARVKGRSGARFQKALSPQEEAEILTRWGF